MIIALAGRRVDAENASQPRFPANRIEGVKQQIKNFLRSNHVSILVCAAACGADILALEAAGELELRRYVVLPFDHVTFRASSVIDRGGDWGERYDRIITEVTSEGSLVEFTHDKTGAKTYFTGNLDILDQAQRLERELNIDVGAIVVWDGESRGEDDVTGDFKQKALARGLDVSEVHTLS